MSHDDFDRLGEFMAGPNMAMVEKGFPLPDLREIVEGLSPMDAFKEFMEYAERAIGKLVSTEIYGALTRELLNANSRRGHNGEGRIYPMLTTEQATARGHALRHALSERFAPLLPAIREYVAKRLQDPAILNRLAWFADHLAGLSSPRLSKGRIFGMACAEKGNFGHDREPSNRYRTTATNGNERHPGTPALDIHHLRVRSHFHHPFKRRLLPNTAKGRKRKRTQLHRLCACAIAGVRRERRRWKLPQRRATSGAVEAIGTAPFTRN